MVFKLLFNREKISKWKDKYFNYEESKTVLHDCKKLKEKLKYYEDKVSVEENALKKEKIMLKINNIEEKIRGNMFFLKKIIDTQFTSIIRFFNKKYKQLQNDLEIVKNILSNIEKIKDEEFDLNLKGLKILDIRKFKKDHFLFIINNSLRTLYEIATWARNFSVLNGLAFDKMLSKCGTCIRDYIFKSTFLNKKELEKFFTEYVDMIQSYKREVVVIYAKLFHNGDEEKAARNIKSVTALNIINDKWVIFLLTILTIILFLFFIFVYAPSDRNYNVDLIGVFFPAFNFTLIILLMFLTLAIDMIVLRYYRINFVYLLEMDPSIHLYPLKLFRIILTLLLIWGLIFIFFVISITLYYKVMKSYLYIFTIFILICLFIFVFWPFRSLLYGLRIYLMRLLGEFLFPIGKRTVHFKLVIFSGLMTTFSKTYVPLVMALCIFWCPKCRKDNQRFYCETLYIPFYLMQILPYFLRVIQAFNFAYHKNALWPHMGTASRFLASCAVITCGFLNSYENSSIYFTIGFSFLSYFLNLFMDYYVSWQLFQKNAKYLFLRDKIIYPRWFYYTVMVLNLFFRGTWSFRFVILPTQTNLYIFMISFVEVLRRGLFILIRIENESINNPEKFRKYVPIPEVTEETQNINK